MNKPSDIHPGIIPIVDPNIVNCMKEIPLAQWLEEWKFNKAFQIEFIERHIDWIESSKLNRVCDLKSRWKNKHMTSGVTQALDDFHFVNNGHIMVFEDEYPYHKKTLNLKYFLDQGFKNIGGVIISLPYYANGDQPENYKEIMSKCESFSIPVMIDCAHFGTGTGLESSLFDYDCIQAVAFSLSKPLAMGRWRVGTVFTNIDLPHISVLNDSFYTPMLAAKIGMHLMDNFSSDYIYETYKPLQDIICQQNNLFPSPVAMTAHDGDGKRWGIAKGLMRLIKEGDNDE